MTDYFDPHVTARSEGFNRGLLDGESFGREQGLREGYDRGRADGLRLGKRKGYDEGWSAAVKVANVNIRKQQEFTGKHVADKKKLQAQVDEQSKLIAQLTTRLDEMERENAQVKAANTKLRDVVTALKGANERLQAELTELDSKLSKCTEDYHAQVWKCNQNIVFMNSVRLVLEDLTYHGATPRRVQEMFVLRYREQVEKGVQSGAIKAPLDKDEAFARALPKTQKFILDMLNAVATNDASETPGTPGKQVGQTEAEALPAERAP